MSGEFVHLRLHTEFSMRDGLVRIPELLAQVKENNMSTAAITDHGNLCGMVKFYTKAIAQGIKPLIAADVMLRDGDEHSLITLYCQNQTGYQNLTWLLSEGYQHGQQHSGEPEILREWIITHSEGLIVLTGLHSDVGHALISKKHVLAEEQLAWWQHHFPNRHYIELTRTQRPHENTFNQAAAELACKHQIPLVATNDVRFLNQEDFEAHEARVCIHDGYVLDDKNRPRRYHDSQYFKSSQEMTTLFADLPSAIENTVEIAKRCTCPVTLGDVFLPEFPVPKGHDTNTYLEALSHECLNKYLDKIQMPKERRGVYVDRLNHELSVIIQMGFPGYFLIVADFIGWAKRNDIPVGPGRGSGAGSLVAFVLQITTLDPLQHELLFERFLNPERVSMPDFDIDFCMERRDRVIEYVAERYGRDAVSQIITYGTMAAKAVVRDVGRVLGMSYGFCDKLAKLIPFEIGITLDKAMEQEEELARRYREETEVTTLMDLAKKLEGITRNAGKHAGGVVIAPGKLTDFTPLYCEADGSNLVTQFDKNDVESVGLVKFDFLGLRTLTIIDWALQTINAKRHAQGEASIIIDDIPTDDPAVFKLLQNCETTAVFQLESRGMKELVKRLQPDCFDDVTALVALFRPGPLQSGMVDDYIDRKHGRATVHYPHPDVEDILKPTNGVILYQEQVMQIAQVLANYTLGGADLLRRAMGKKKPEEMAKQRTIFVEGATKRGIETTTSEYIFDLMEKFAGYGFNKSHSAAYALIAYQTAWLKAHYPSEFMAAVLSSDMDNTDKVVGFVQECERMKLTVIPPNINSGMYQFTVNASGEIVYGLGAIKGVGQAVIEAVVAERRAHGAFDHLYSLCQRLDGHKLNRRVLESLIKAGALDIFGVNRATLMASISCALKSADQKARADAIGQSDLFGGARADNEAAALSYIESAPWLEQQKLQFEKDTLGYYISGHPFGIYQKELAGVTSCALGALGNRPRKSATVAGILVGLRTVFTKAGKRMGILKLEDATGSVEITLFNRLFEEVRESLQTDVVVMIKGKVEEDQYTGGVRMVAENLRLLEEYRAQSAKQLVLSLASHADISDFLKQLPDTLAPYRQGVCPLTIKYQNQGASAEIQLGKEWQVKPTDALLTELSQLCGREQVEVMY